MALVINPAVNEHMDAVAERLSKIMQRAGDWSAVKPWYDFILEIGAAITFDSEGWTLWRHQLRFLGLHTAFDEAVGTLENQFEFDGGYAYEIMSDLLALTIELCEKYDKWSFPADNPRIQELYKMRDHVERFRPDPRDILDPCFR